MALPGTLSMRLFRIKISMRHICPRLKRASPRANPLKLWYVSPCQESVYTISVAKGSSLLRFTVEQVPLSVLTLSLAVRLQCH